MELTLKVVHIGEHRVLASNVPYPQLLSVPDAEAGCKVIRTENFQPYKDLRVQIHIGPCQMDQDLP